MKRRFAFAADSAFDELRSNALLVSPSAIMRCPKTLHYNELYHCRSVSAPLTVEAFDERSIERRIRAAAVAGWWTFCLPRCF